MVPREERFSTEAQAGVVTAFFKGVGTPEVPRSKSYRDRIEKEKNEWV
jgi:hypothetical protein